MHNSLVLSLESYRRKMDFDQSRNLHPAVFFAAVAVAAAVVMLGKKKRN